MDDMFLCSSPVLDLEACVLREHNPLIMWYKFISMHIYLYDQPSSIQLDYTNAMHGVSVYAMVLGLSGQLSGGFDLGHNSQSWSESS